MKRFYILLLIVSTLAVSCTNKGKELTSGTWRALLYTSDSTEIPFNFNLKLSETDTIMEIITGDNIYTVKEIHRRGDSLFITMPLFSSSFELEIGDDSLEGKFIRSTYDMNVKAYPGIERRFMADPSENSSMVAGRWLVNLGKREIIGEFAEKDGKVTGSFLTPTGDYRFFEGIMEDTGELTMSCFDGGFIRLFKAKVVGKDSLADVVLYSGYNTIEMGFAQRKEDATLPDAYSVTGMKSGYTTFGFSFPDLNGTAVALNSERFRDKVVILQISGSWCPNCLDESRFLSEMKSKFEPSLEVVALAFERVEEYSAAKKEAMKLVDAANINYDVLITGHSPSRLKDALPELENFKAFPTTVYIDRKGVVRRIHSGFNGPGTGVHYQKFREEFISFVESLIEDK
ncbi:MAG: TlpA disulfide reductase family protein [Bacteroidales bacterium]|jgi:thiol-disulfide isomerase/thioredoxin|nr:TlpA disulfide reductase family protein [Bacteroidales bacterium]MDD3273072.1 TlpA disulfide reductase family protein [Bacteroidales bacterium]MDD4057559.1 TlpA disulfide reductase family protein [Bacteroidales bacterium]